MTHSLLERQSELPRSVPLFRYAPERVRFSWKDWDPSIARSGTDLPQYLILGDLDPSTFEQSASGWSARWQGTEHDTHFEVAYQADASRWEIRQTWCVNGCQETLFSGFEGAVSGIDGRLDRGVPVLGRPEGGQARGRGQLRGKAVG